MVSVILLIKLLMQDNHGCSRSEFIVMSVLFTEVSVVNMQT